MKKRSSFKIMFELIGLVKPMSGYMALAVIMGVIGFLSAIFIPILGGYALMESFNAKTIFTLLIILACVRGVLRYAEQACNHFIAFKILALIRDHVFAVLRKLAPAKLDGKDKGSLISLVTSDIELLEVFYAHTISPILIAIIVSLIMTVFVGSYHIVFAVIAICAYMTVGIAMPLIASKYSKEIGNRYRDLVGELSNHFLDSLRGIKEIIQYDSGRRRMDKMNRDTAGIIKEGKELKKNTSLNSAVTNTCVYVFSIAMLVFGIFLYNNGAVSKEGVVISVIAIISSFGPVIAVANLGSSLSLTFAAGNRVLDLLDEEPIVEEIKDGKEVKFKDTNIKNVTFSYGDEAILNNLTLDIKQGKITGITGQSGSGKSTLLKLMMRFWESDEGDILISDENINGINTGCLRKNQSLVTQDTHLFHDSIRNNLILARPEASQEEIENACRKASIHDFIASLPKGYDTAVGELGDTLSGGEKQRLGLARAFLRDSKYLLLDEPTSNLDSLNEAVILKALKEDRDRTVVLVSHRASTMKIVDHKYSVEYGRLS